MLHNLKTRQKITVAILLALFCFTLILIPAKNAKAQVPVNPVAALAAIFNTSVQTTIANTNWGLKNWILNAAGAGTRLAIRTLRDSVIGFIATGQFQVPSFVASFTADPHKMAENAARLFMSRISGIDFCNWNLRPPDRLKLQVSLRFDLQCNVRNFRQHVDDLANTMGYGQENNPQNNLTTADQIIEHWTDEFLAINEDDPVYGVYKAATLKKQNEKLAQKSFFDEAMGTGGFIGQRDPITKKINTPGSALAGMLGAEFGGNMRQCDTAQEFHNVLVSCTLEAIASITDSAF